jgi:hypothetical protein
MEGVRGSIPLAPTIFCQENLSLADKHFRSLLEARTQLERARQLYDEAWAAEARSVIAMDFLAALEASLAATAWCADDVDAAKTHFQTAAAGAESTDCRFPPNSRWKNPLRPGQLSVEINSRRYGEDGAMIALLFDLLAVVVMVIGPAQRAATRP